MMIAATKVPSPTKEEACTDRKLRVETGPRSACRFQVRGAGGATWISKEAPAAVLSLEGAGEIGGTVLTSDGEW